MDYDVIIIGAGPGGIFAAYELAKQRPGIRVAVFESGHALERRRCPIAEGKVASCIGCKPCSIMSGVLGRQVQHHQRLRRHALRVRGQGEGPRAHALRR